MILKVKLVMKINIKIKLIQKKYLQIIRKIFSNRFFSSLIHCFLRRLKYWINFFLNYSIPRFKPNYFEWIKNPFSPNQTKGKGTTTATTDTGTNINAAIAAFR